jgi:hypothetical protein
MVAARVHSEKLAIQLMRQPRQRMPLAGPLQTERPLEIFDAQTISHMVVFADDKTVIVVNEVVVLNLPINEKHPGYQARNNRGFQPRVWLFNRNKLSVWRNVRFQQFVAFWLRHIYRRQPLFSAAENTCPSHFGQPEVTLTPVVERTIGAKKTPLPPDNACCHFAGVTLPPILKEKRQQLG